MPAAGASLTIEQLADQTGVPVRTIRYYVSQGLLPGPGTRGKGASYGDEHLLRLRLIRLLLARGIPLAEQRERLSALSLDEIRGLLDKEEQRKLELERARHTPTARTWASVALEHAPQVDDVPPVLSAPAPGRSASENPLEGAAIPPTLSSIGHRQAARAEPAR